MDSKIATEQRINKFGVGLINCARESGGELYDVERGCTYADREGKLMRIFDSLRESCPVIGFLETSEMMRPIKVQRDSDVWRYWHPKSLRTLDYMPSNEEITSIRNELEHGQCVFLQFEKMFDGVLEEQNFILYKIKEFSDLADYVRTKGYEVINVVPNPGIGSIGSTITWDPKRVFLLEHHTKYLSDTPTIPSGGGGFGRPVILSKFQMVNGEYFTDQTFWTALTALSIPPERNVEDAKHLAEVINTYVQGDDCVIFGDFNVFVDRGSAGNEMIIPANCQNVICIEKYLDSAGNETNTTWCGFPTNMPSNPETNYRTKSFIWRDTIKTDDEGNTLQLPNYPLDRVLYRFNSQLKENPFIRVLTEFEGQNCFQNIYSDHFTIWTEFEFS